METEWVKVCPYLQVEPPNPRDSDYHEKVKDVMEIYSFFKEENPSDFLKEFLRLYTKLSSVPDLNDTKTSQMLKAVKLLKIARNTRSQLKELHKTTRNSVFERVLDKTYEALNKMGIKQKRPV